MKVNYKIVGRRAGDIEKVWADTTLANNELGWKAVTPIEETLANAWKWQRTLDNKKVGDFPTFFQSLFNCHGFCQVSRHIHVATSHYGNVIGDEL